MNKWSAIISDVLMAFFGLAAFILGMVDYLGLKDNLSHVATACAVIAAVFFFTSNGFMKRHVDQRERTQRLDDDLVETPYLDLENDE